MTAPEDDLVPTDEAIEDEENEELAPKVISPNIDTSEKELEHGEYEIEYSDRGPNDIVLSGPLLGGWGPGRFFQSRGAALVWATQKYGPGRVKKVKEQPGRWAYLVKNLCQSTN